MPQVSVIIPVHNRPAELCRAVQSVLEQRYRDFELIVIDDGSTAALDEARTLVESSGHRFVSQLHGGVAAARNHGARLARGVWLAFLDSDDWWLARKLELQLELHRQRPELKISHTREIWYRNGVRVNPKLRHEPASGMAFERSLELCCISPSAALVDAELFRALGGFDERLSVCEDFDLWLRVTKDFEVGLVIDALVIKTGGHPDQLSKSEPAMDRFRVYALLNLFADGGLADADRSAVLREIARRASILNNGACRRDAPTAALYRDIESWSSCAEPPLEHLRTFVSILLTGFRGTRREGSGTSAV